MKILLDAGIVLPQIGAYFNGLDADDSPMEGEIDKIELTRWGSKGSGMEGVTDLIAIYIWIGDQMACWVEYQVREPETCPFCGSSGGDVEAESGQDWGLMYFTCLPCGARWEEHARIEKVVIVKPPDPK